MYRKLSEPVYLCMTLLSPSYKQYIETYLTEVNVCRGIYSVQIGVKITQLQDVMKLVCRDFQ